MRGLIFVLMIMAGLLVFGCVGGPAEQQPGTTTQTTTQQTTQQQTEEQTTQETGETKPAETESVGGDFDLDDKTYLELASLGVPIKCEITSTYGGVTTTATLYMVGEDKIRMEVPSAGRTMVSLYLDKTLYIKNVMADMYPDCEWLVIEYDETTGEPTGTTEGGMSYESPTAELKDIPAQDFKCEAWAYDNSKFTVPTQSVCTQEEFEALIMQGYDTSEYQ